jgi:tetrapyrrole methylase family protein/MazG family protein/ATP diphosphatase
MTLEIPHEASAAGRPLVPEVPALPEQSGASFAALVHLMQRLLAPDGCPWDREQDERSLRRYVLEEACEVIDAIDQGDDAQLREELGDLSLQVAFLSELARRRAAFGPDDVMRSICEKLVRRHPHVFASGAASNSLEVEQSWERIKLAEKNGARRTLLDGLPRSFPALQRASEFSRRAARVGFDWPDGAGAFEKVQEELAEVKDAKAQSAERLHEEFGDLLFALVNWARHLGVDPEQALSAACDKFKRRFEHVETQVLQVHGDWPRDARGKPSAGLSLHELDGYWEQSKRAEREPAP